MNKFKVAFKGLFLAFKHHAVIIQGILGIMALIGAYILKFNYIEYIIFILCIGLVIALEIVNTTIERICDLIDINYNEKIKDIKDISSGAVLVVAIMSFIICLIIVINKGVL